MPSYDTERLVARDKSHLWHPFTQMREWIAADHEPIVLVTGQGAWLEDSRGRRYLDGNSSIWTNIHGHRHPRLDQAIREQLESIAHTSFLGFTHPRAVELAEQLVALLPGSPLSKVFLSDNGSTAIEVAIKMSAQYFLQNARPEKTGFIAFENAYHGDTLGAASLGGIPVFHERFRSHHFPVTRIGSAEELAQIEGSVIAGLVVEPLIQGSAGMQLWPAEMLKRLRVWCDEQDVFLIFDEVMTGFGRTGSWFALEHENVYPDFLAIAKGMTGGYLPLAATLTTERVYEGFLGAYEELRTLFYGHSYTGNALGCAVALANLAVFKEERTLENLQPKIQYFGQRLKMLEQLPNVRAVRRCGFISGIELSQSNGEPLDWRRQMGAKVCLAARKHGLLTRAIRDVIVLMLPLCVTNAEIDLTLEAIEKGIHEEFEERKPVR
jgi:adenosylmethionine-8-amino-7-oxononanoate aminotransferase